MMLMIIDVVILVGLGSIELPAWLLSGKVKNCKKQSRIFEPNLSQIPVRICTIVEILRVWICWAIAECQTNVEQNQNGILYSVNRKIQALAISYIIDWDIKVGGI